MPCHCPPAGGRESSKSRDNIVKVIDSNIDAAAAMITVGNNPVEQGSVHTTVIASDPSLFKSSTTVWVFKYTTPIFGPSFFAFLVKQVSGFSGRSGRLIRNRVRITSRRATVNDFLIFRNKGLPSISIVLPIAIGGMRRTGKYRHQPGDLPSPQ